MVGLIAYYRFSLNGIRVLQLLNSARGLAGLSFFRRCCKVVVEHRKTCTLIKKRASNSNQLYIVGHSSSVTAVNAERGGVEPLNLTTYFNVPVPVCFYCPDGHTLLLNSGFVVGGLHRLPPVIDTYYVGSRVRDHFVWPPHFTFHGVGRVSPYTSRKKLEDAVAYNDDIGFDVAMVERQEKVRLSDLLRDIASAHCYHSVHALFCRTF